MHDDSDRLIRLHLLLGVKRPSSVRENDLLVLTKCRVFCLYFYIGAGEEGFFKEIVDLVGIGVGYPEYVLVQGVLRYAFALLVGKVQSLTRVRDAAGVYLLVFHLISTNFVPLHGNNLGFIREMDVEVKF